jgi:DNA polymerase-3 subunit delta'
LAQDTEFGTENPALPPRANPDLLGHEAAERELAGLWRAGRLPHAILLAGPRGIGKATLAFRFARFLLAQGKREGLFAAAEGGPGSRSTPTAASSAALRAARTPTC